MKPFRHVGFTALSLSLAINEQKVNKQTYKIILSFLILYLNAHQKSRLIIVDEKGKIQRAEKETNYFYICVYNLSNEIGVVL